jgi:hypothetical protein
LHRLDVPLAAIHIAAGIKLKELSQDGIDLVELPARISLIVGPLMLSGVIIGRVRRRLRRS